MTGINEVVLELILIGSWACSHNTNRCIVTVSLLKCKQTDGLMIKAFFQGSFPLLPRGTKRICKKKKKKRTKPNFYRLS